MTFHHLILLLGYVLNRSDWINYNSCELLFVTSSSSSSVLFFFQCFFHVTSFVFLCFVVCIFFFIDEIQLNQITKLQSSTLPSFLLFFWKEIITHQNSAQTKPFKERIKPMIKEKKQKKRRGWESKISYLCFVDSLRDGKRNLRSDITMRKRVCPRNFSWVLLFIHS